MDVPTDVSLLEAQAKERQTNRHRPWYWLGDGGGCCDSTSEFLEPGRLQNRVPRRPKGRRGRRDSSRLCTPRSRSRGGC